MEPLPDFLVFWIFAAIFTLSLASIIVLGKLLGISKPTPNKLTVFECGQKPMGRARDFKITGALRYFVYAVAFFALDAFTWIVLASSTTIAITPVTLLVLTLYVAIIFLGIIFLLTYLPRIMT